MYERADRLAALVAERGRTAGGVADDHVVRARSVQTARIARPTRSAQENASMKSRSSAEGTAYSARSKRYFLQSPARLCRF
jgi:hypothetical protein